MVDDSVVDVWCGGCLVWWMSSVVDVRSGGCLVWSMSGVLDVLFYMQCGGCLVWWMPYNQNDHNSVCMMKVHLQILMTFSKIQKCIEF